MDNSKTTLAKETMIPSFIASLYMGLKEKFEGSVDHLQVTIQEESIPGTNVKKQYIILYDQVPGGTGYLKELVASPEIFLEMLQLAYDKLNLCICQNNPDNDGCYRCIYAYRVSRDLPKVKRSDALSAYRFPLDARQRMALVRSGKYLCWSLSYDDVMTKFEDNSSNSHWSPLFTKPVMSIPNIDNSLLSEINNNAFDLLLCLLASSNMSAWKDLAKLYGINILTQKGFNLSNSDYQEIHHLLLEESDFSFVLSKTNEIVSVDPFSIYFTTRNVIKGNSVLCISAAINKDEFKKFNYSSISVVLRLDDLQTDIDQHSYRYQWNSLLNAYNILQFLPESVIISSRFIHEGYSIPQQRILEQSSDEWNEVFELADITLHPLLHKLCDEGATKPEIGYELANSSGEVVASAELVWKSEKIAVLLTSDDINAFKELDWHVIIKDESNWKEQLFSLLSGGEN